ncbi:MAG: hypothetical protein ACHQNA_06695 [Acidimicrobiales bacterium]
MDGITGPLTVPVVTGRLVPVGWASKRDRPGLAGDAARVIV